MLGSLLPIQVLPSVRRVEEQTGIGRNVVWRAYSRLAKEGVLTIIDRQKVMVSADIAPNVAAELLRMGDYLAADLLKRLQALNINRHSFLRLLDHRIQQAEAAYPDIVVVECNRYQAERFAVDVSELFGFRVPGYDLKELAQLPPERRREFRRVLTPLYHHNEVEALFSKLSTEVIAIHLSWAPDTLNALRALPRGSLLAVVLEPSECTGYGEPLARELRQLCRNIRVELVVWKDQTQLVAAMKKKRFAKLLLTGRVMEAVTEEIRDSPLVLHRPFRVDPGYLEQIRVKTGILF
jgi:DNA-binding transcriptional regulator YhcF (GntR family)